MLKPAGSCRKPKPDLIWRAARLAPTFCASSATSTTSASAKPPCTTSARSRRARSRRRQAASPAGRVMPSADRRRVHQAALVPQVVDAARQPHRALGAEVALEALAVVAHLLDDAVGPLLVEAEQLAHV